MLYGERMLIHRGFKYRIYPTPEQEARLEQWERALRFLWNLGLEQWHLWMHGAVPRRFRGERVFVKADGVTDEQANAEPLDLRFYHAKREHHKYPSAMGQNRELTELRAEHAWIADVPRNVCEALFFDLETAWKRCFERGGAPHWKRKGDAVGMCEPHGRAFTIGANHVVFPKLGKIEAVIHRPLGGKQKAITITRDAGEWYASVMCEVEVADPMPSTKPAVGIDRGVVNLLADSNGRMVPADLKREAKMRAKIARTQRVIARRKKGGKNRQKAIDKLARLHQTQRRQREHVLHVESHHYATNYGSIVIERLNVRGMTASAAGTPEEPGANVRQKAGLNRSILASGWSKFAEMVKYKVVPEGAVVREADPAYSSCECSACGHIDKASRRTQSEFCCTGCGHAENADTNAAKVLEKRGCTAAEHAVAACGGSGTGRPLKQEKGLARAPRQPKQSSIAKSGERRARFSKSKVHSKGEPQICENGGDVDVVAVGG